MTYWTSMQSFIRAIECEKYKEYTNNIKKFCFPEACKYHKENVARSYDNKPKSYFRIDIFKHKFHYLLYLESCVTLPFQSL